MPRVLALALVLVTAGAADAQIRVQSRVGFDFEHFGESYRITSDQDTVTTINDYGTLVGLRVTSPPRSESRFRLDSHFHLGKESRRLRLDFDGRLGFGENSLRLEHDGVARLFNEDGDYSVVSDYLQQFVRLTYERRFGPDVRWRLRDLVDVTWYDAPNEYNLNSWIHRPGTDLRVRFGNASEARVGYQFGTREVPDSTSLNYDRHTIEGDLSLLFGWTSMVEVTALLDRRLYDPISVRESSWELRGDGRFEFSVGTHATFRLLHEYERIRYDEPDDLDFDSDWARSGFQIEIHRSRSVDLSLMPVYAWMASDTSPVEEYTETGLEFGIDLRIGTRTWINVTNEIGRRDYEISAVTESGTVTDLADLTSLESDGFLVDTAYSDYIYNRLTAMVSSDVTRGIAVNLFVNWQPEDHNINRHDTNTRIVSGGVEYRF